MSISKAIDARETAEEAKFARAEDAMHLQEIAELGMQGAFEREVARHPSAHKGHVAAPKDTYVDDTVAAKQTRGPARR